MSTKIILVLLIIVLMILMGSCINHQNDIKLNDEAIQENNKKPTSQEELLEDVLSRKNNVDTADDLISKFDDRLIFSSFRLSNSITSLPPTIFMFDSVCEIECLRILDDFCYSVHKIDENGYCFVFYDSPSRPSISTIDSVYVNKGYNSYNEFKNLIENEAVLSDAKEIDPTLYITETDNGTFMGETVLIEGYRIEIICSSDYAIGKDGEPSPIIVEINFIEKVYLREVYDKLLTIDKEVYDS